MNTGKNIGLKSAIASGIVFMFLVTAVFLLFRDGMNPRIWRSLLVNYLFFTSAAAGLTVWPAIILVSNGKWMHSLEKVCQAGISFSVVSLFTLILLWVSSDYSSLWTGLPGKFWLNKNFLFLRNLVMQTLFWFIVYLFINKRHHKNPTFFTGFLVLFYAITFSLAGFDFIMSLQPGWSSMMTGGYFAISGLYIAVAAWAFLSVILERDIRKDNLQDIGSLITAFCMLTGYLMLSHLLPIWYENLPEETSFLVPRMNLAWKPVSYALLGTVYAGPVFLLMSRKVKGNVTYMGVISAAILLGMWVERWWLVSAIFEKNRILFGWPEVIVLLVFAATMTIGIWVFMRKERNSKLEPAHG